MPEIEIFAPEGNLLERPAMGQAKRRLRCE
jgi:hypothetical protein